MGNQPSYSDLVSKIAKLERVNETLRRSSNRLEQVPHIANLGILEWCSSSGPVYFNTNFLDMAGLKREELNKFTFDLWLNRLHPDDRNEAENKIHALFKGEIEQSQNEFRIFHPKSKWVWLNEISRVISRDSEGSPLCIISVFQDISNRKRIDQELGETKTTLENILNSIIPICVTNLQYEILLTNISYNAIFGKPTSGMRCFESRKGPSCHTENCPIHHFLNGAEKFICETTIKESQDIPAKTFLVCALPFYNSQHDIIGLVESFQDITKLTDLEKEKNQLIEKLQQALSHVKKLSGFLPICASCKKIRDDSGYWNQIETYIRDHSEAEFSHSLCPECSRKLYPELHVGNKSEES